MSLTPDIAGFAEAQDRLREQMGQDVAFSVPETPVFDPAVQLDPESGQPYDPTVVPTSGGGTTEVTIKVTVVFRPIHVNIEDPTQTGPLGLSRAESVALILNPADFPSVEHANAFDLNGINYRITEIVPDGLTTIHRYVCFGEAR